MFDDRRFLSIAGFCRSRRDRSRFYSTGRYGVGTRSCSTTTEQREVGVAGNDSSAVTRDEIAQLIEPVIAEAGFDLEDLVLHRMGRAMVLRVVIDGDAGVSLDAAAAISGTLSRLLDAAATDDMLGKTSYTLEVTSPGVDRPLTTPRHWRRNSGRLVRVSTPQGELSGRIQRADDTGVTLLLEGEVARTLPYGQLGPGAVQLEFRRLEEIPVDDESE